ncbi:MAG: hypothetical protein K6C13_04995 [Oscillospiraceae bacterium]|nr:hypothetical protein [Oscillospiraceae bacterium]
MAKIDINTAEVKKQSALLKEASAQLIKGTVRPLTEVNERLASEWTGDSARAFSGYMNELISLLQSNAEDIGEIAGFLNDACISIENADQQIKTKLL